MSAFPSAEAWRVLSLREQFKLLLGLPADGREEYLAGSDRCLRSVLECVPRFTGDIPLGRLAVRDAIGTGDWVNNAAQLAALREDEELLTAFVKGARSLDIQAARWEQGLGQTLLEMWPAVELKAIYGRLPKGTREKWQTCGGSLYGKRMIALKTDSVWRRFSDFDRPHPPFSLGGENLEVDDVSREEAVRLNLL